MLGREHLGKVSKKFIGNFYFWGITLNNLAARRKRFLNLAFLLVLLISQRNITVPSPVRSCRRLKRNTGWWENVCNTYWDARFKKTFRISRDTFNFILNRIASFLIRQTVTEEPISPALRLAICLYRLGRGDYLYAKRNTSVGIFPPFCSKWSKPISFPEAAILLVRRWGSRPLAHTAVKRGARAQFPPKPWLNKVLNFQKFSLSSPKLRQSLKS